MDERAKSKDLLVQWLENFKANVGELQEAAATIEECEAVLTDYKNIVEKARIPLLIKSSCCSKGGRKLFGIWTGFSS